MTVKIGVSPQIHHQQQQQQQYRHHPGRSFDDDRVDPRDKTYWGDGTYEQVHQQPQDQSPDYNHNNNMARYNSPPRDNQHYSNYNIPRQQQQNQHNSRRYYNSHKDSTEGHRLSGGNGQQHQTTSLPQHLLQNQHSHHQQQRNTPRTSNGYKSINDYYRQQHHEIEFSNNNSGEEEGDGDLFSNPWSALEKHNQQRPLHYNQQQQQQEYDMLKDFQSERSVCSTWTVSEGGSSGINDATIPSVIFALQEEKMRLKREKARLQRENYLLQQNNKSNNSSSPQIHQPNLHYQQQQVMDDQRPLTPTDSYHEPPRSTRGGFLQQDKRRRAALEHVQQRLRKHCQRQQQQEEENEQQIQQQQQQLYQRGQHRINNSRRSNVSSQQPSLLPPNASTYHPSGNYPDFSPKTNMNYSKPTSSQQQQQRRGHPSFNRRTIHDLLRTSGSGNNDLEQRHVRNEMQSILASAKQNQGKDGIALPRLDNVPENMLDRPLLPPDLDAKPSLDSGISSLTENRKAAAIRRRQWNDERAHRYLHNQHQSNNGNSKYDSRIALFGPGQRSPTTADDMVGSSGKGFFRGGYQRQQQQTPPPMEPTGAASTASGDTNARESFMSSLDRLRSNLRSKQNNVSYTMAGIASDLRAKNLDATNCMSSRLRGQEPEKEPLLNNGRHISDVFSDIKSRINFKGGRHSSVRKDDESDMSPSKLRESSRLAKDDESYAVFAERPDPEASTIVSNNSEARRRKFSRNLDKLLTAPKSVASISKDSGYSTRRSQLRKPQISSLYLPNLRSKDNPSPRSGVPEQGLKPEKYMAENSRKRVGQSTLSRGYNGPYPTQETTEVGSLTSQQSTFTPTRPGGITRRKNLRPALKQPQPSSPPRQRKHPFFTKSRKEDIACHRTAPVKSRHCTSDGISIVDMASEASDTQSNAQSSVSSFPRRKKKVGFHDDVIDVTSLASSRVSCTTVKSVTLVDDDSQGVIYTKRKVTAMPRTHESKKFYHKFHNHDNLEPVEEEPQNKRIRIGKKWDSDRYQLSDRDEEVLTRDRYSNESRFRQKKQQTRSSQQLMNPQHSTHYASVPPRSRAPEEQIVFASESRDDLFPGILEVNADETLGTVVSGLTRDERRQRRDSPVKDQAYESYASSRRRDRYNSVDAQTNRSGTCSNPLQMAGSQDYNSILQEPHNRGSSRSRQVTPTTDNLSSNNALSKQGNFGNSGFNRLQSSPVYDRARSMFPSQRYENSNKLSYSDAQAQQHSTAYSKNHRQEMTNVSHLNRGQDAPISPLQTRDPDGVSVKKGQTPASGTVATGITTELRESGIPRVVSCERDEASSVYSKKCTRYANHPWEEERRPGGRTLSQPIRRDAPSTIDLHGQQQQQSVSGRRADYSILESTGSSEADDETELTDRLVVAGDDESQIYEIFPSPVTSPRHIDDESSDDTFSKDGLEMLKKTWASVADDGESLRVRARRRRKQKLTFPVIEEKDKTSRPPLFFDMLCRI